MTDDMTSDLPRVFCSPNRMASSFIRRQTIVCGARQAAGLTQSSILNPQSSILNPQSSKGFSLVSAIFLLVVIAALGTFAVTLSTTQHQSSALDVMGVRAYHAARAGIEWGAYQVVTASAASCSIAGTATNVAMPAGSTLAPFAVNVNCRNFAPVSEAANTVTMYQVTSTASQGTVATPGYVERQLSLTMQF